MIHGVLLRWVVTGLFALGAIECALPILTRRRPWPMVLSHGLHVVMAVAMAAMAWPWSMRAPTTALTVVFLLAAAWFATMALAAARTPAQRRLSGYHVLMMLATAWMYAAMNGPPTTAPAPARSGAAMPGMDMAATGTPPYAAWITAMDWLGALIFGAATLFWTLRYLTGTARLKSLGNLAQAAMAAGMAVLFLAAVSRI
ncbi:DUF5134 domain-containing protein [Mycobacterium servetii]|uniref:DUF5134 domain-containing protein n=1 Tax=Mycobacterium servetii TaxID=3237418 RepID=A0ABV4C711_9MYCO